MFVNMMWSMGGLCLALSRRLFMFEMLDSIVLALGELQPEWIPIYFLSPHPFSVKVGSIKLDGKLSKSIALHFIFQKMHLSQYSKSFILSSISFTCAISLTCIRNLVSIKCKDKWLNDAQLPSMLNHHVSSGSVKITSEYKNSQIALFFCALFIF